MKKKSPTNFVLNPKRRLIRWIFTVFGGVLCGWGLLSQIFLSDATHRTLWIVDSSLSMAVQDIQGEGSAYVSRLDAVKKLMQSEIMNTSGEHAILSFARYPTLQTPFTSDRIHLDNIITGLAPVAYGGGSDMNTALAFAEQLYKNTSNLSVIILTDGEFFGDTVPRSSLPTLFPTLWIGVGTEAGGRILQGYDSQGKPLYREYQGSPVISRLSRSELETYTDQYHSSLGWLPSYQEIPSLQASIHTLSIESDHSRDLLIMLGVVLLIIGLILPQYHYTR